MVSNAYFSFGSNRFDVVAQSVSYSHKMDIVQSNARRRQTFYPKKWQQRSVNIKLIFDSPQTYMAFGDFLKTYFYAAVSTNGYTALRFVCEHIGCDLNVIPTTDSLTVKVDSVAPTMLLNCKVVNNNAIESQSSVARGRDITPAFFYDSNSVATYDEYAMGQDNVRVRVVDGYAKLGRLFVYTDEYKNQNLSLDRGYYYLHVAYVDVANVNEDMGSASTQAWGGSSDYDYVASGSGFGETGYYVEAYDGYNMVFVPVTLSWICGQRTFIDVKDVGLRNVVASGGKEI